ncbi:hypothetical protein QYM36_001195 [Artemia franciscana]|nr:hypothetical protein QYM36_001195 [Artemia franciscana]
MKKYRQNMREEQKSQIRKYDAMWHRSARWPVVEAATPLLQPKAEVKEEPVYPNEGNIVIHPTAENATNFCQIFIKAEQEDVADVKPSVEQISLPTEQSKVKQRIKTIMDNLQVREEPRPVINSIVSNHVPALLSAPVLYLLIPAPASLSVPTSAPELQHLLK